MSNRVSLPSLHSCMSEPFSAIFALERKHFQKHQGKTLDALEKGHIKFEHKQSFDPYEPILQSIQSSEDDRRYIVTGALVSLTGANGILPSHYSETLAKTLRDKNTVFKDFLDIFNHRLNSLMYRSWAKYRLDADKAYQVSIERYQSTVDLMMSVFAGTAYAKPDPTMLYFSGLTYATTKSADKLKSIIEELAELEVTINEFKGKWIELAEDQLSRITTNQSQQTFNQLGINTMLGRRCWDLSSAFEIEIEVDNAESFSRLTPGGDLHKLIKKTVSNLVGENFEFNFKLKVKEADCQRVRLSKDEHSSKLGSSAWMGHNSRQDKTINYYC